MFQANSASPIGGADAARRAGWMAGRPIGRLAALGALDAGAHSLLYQRVLKLGKRAKHLKHRLTCRRGGIEALPMQVEIDLERVQFG